MLKSALGLNCRTSMRLLIEVLVALLVLAAIALVVGKRHARRFQRRRRIHVDRFKLKRRHADIELEVFGSRDVVEAIRGYAKEHHTSIEDATRQARAFPVMARPIVGICRSAS